MFRCLSVLTRVVVDPATALPPTKPVGPFYTESEAKRLAQARGWDVIPDSGRGWRRVVGSPHPVRIIGYEHIRALISEAIIIAGGGGGIPVVQDGERLVGFDGVIDKDRCSAAAGDRAGGRHAGAADRRAPGGAGLRHPLGAVAGADHRLRRGPRAG